MPSILSQNPKATVTEALEFIPEELISRRESLRMRALIGAVPASMFAERDSAKLADILNGRPIEGLTDRTVIFGFTMSISPKRVLTVAELFLECLHNGVPILEEPKSQQEAAPVLAAPKSGPKSGFRRQGTTHAVEVALAALRRDDAGEPAESVPARKRKQSSGRGRLAGSPADLASRRRGFQE